MRTRNLLAADLTVLALGLAAALSLTGPDPVRRTPQAPRVDAAALEISPLPVTPPVVAAPAPAQPPATRRAAPTTAAAPAPTTRPPAPKTTRPRPAPPALLQGSGAMTTRDIGLYRGLGTWVDAYDFAPEFGGTLLNPEAVVDQMAAMGVKTLYLQAAKEDRRSPGLLVREDLVRRWVARAHARDIKVQAWYLPKLEDVARDEAHLAALLAYRVNGRGFDSIGLDIEARNVSSLAVRNQRIVALSRKLRAAAPTLPLSGIVLAPVHTDIISPAFWPSFPWAQLKDSFDVWQTMGYWTDRKKSSPYSNAHTQTVANVQLLRGHLGDVPIHPIGGIGITTAPEVEGYVRALHETGSLGGSIYDWVTTPLSAYPYLRRVPS